MENQPQAVEQPAGDSASEGIYSMDDAIAAVAEMPYDNDEAAEPEGQPEEPASEEALEEVEESTDEEPESDEDQPEESEEDQPEASDDVTDLPDDDLVIAEDGETKVTLGELREKYQEAAAAKDSMQADYQRKTQALAEKSKNVEASEEKALAHYQSVITALGQGLQQMDQSTDWATLKQTDPAAFQTALAQRNQMEASLEQFGQGANALLDDAKARKSDIEKAQSKEALTFLKESIEGWNQDLYSKVATFAEAQGVSADEFYGLRSGPVLKVLHDLMRSNEAKESALQKIQKKPPTEAKQKAQKRKTLSADQRKTKALEERAKNGDKDAAIELLMRRPYDN